MNRKLKNMLKNAYSAEPNRKYSFIQQLQSDPTWRKLHPISSMIRISSASAFIFSTLATIAVGTGIIAYNFRHDDTTPTPDIPPIVTETTTSSVTTVQTSATKTLHSTAGTITQTTATSTLHSDNTVSATDTTKKMSTTAISAVTSKTSSKVTVTTSKTAETTAVSSSIYYTHLFKHNYTTEDLKNTSLDALYGYPDRNMIEEVIRIMTEENGTDFDEMMQEHGMETADLSYELLDFILAWDTPPIVEGRTTDIQYIAYNGKPWTVCEITLTEVYNFKKNKILNKGDKVKIAMAGGYMPVREYIELNPDSTLFSGWTDEKINATVIYEDGSNQRELKIGDVYTYILNDNSDEIIPDFPVADCFTRQSVSDICQFTQNGDKFISTNTSYSDFYFTTEQLEKYSFDFDDIFKDPDSNRTIGIKNTSFLLAGYFECYSIEPDGRMTYLGECSTDDGFYPFRDENDYTITWTDDSVIIEYRFDYMQDYFAKEQFVYPKENNS
ncbi:MAG: hypothetical protein K2N27_00755 [Ruminococcus sp.]|nr:hypothetical protein [Ruminococcus sp.]